ncbi:fibronectin type III domain-containing protein [Flavobacterium sp. UBA6031]|uniref:fibronectin type III domain-containing protein n=1 Tax=Flavobacterium sp. UBA6031 TaxID=1946551 RepID=UPI0025C3F89C|nr:fibronectin type III domain-containing protein [Flavobacterium sp. UBA6031]
MTLSQAYTHLIMKKVKISVDLSAHKFSDKELSVKTDNILICLTGNRTFAALADQLEVLKNRNDIFRNLLAKMDEGSRLVTAEKKQAREDLESTLRSIAGKVQDISNGDETLIISSGFDINRTPGTVGELEQPLNVVVKQGTTSASLFVSWDVVAHAISYEVRYTKAPVTDASVYMTRTATKHKAVLDGLDLREQYQIQVAGIGSDPIRVWSVAVISGYVS